MMAGLLPMSEPCLLRTCSCLQVIPELEMLHDVHLDSVLGYGGFAAVLRGKGSGHAGYPGLLAAP
jgi:hypothetical protein